MGYDELRARVRETPLRERLEKARSMIAKMCSQKRPPLMSIPASADDEDVFITATLDDALSALQQAEGRSAVAQDDDDIKGVVHPDVPRLRKPERTVMQHGNMVERKTWEEFRAPGLLWWVNRALHLFGWSIVVIVEDETGRVSDAFPARTRFRGFDAASEAEGFVALTSYLQDNAHALLEEAKE